jgi:hypothetical protein
MGHLFWVDLVQFCAWLQQGLQQQILARNSSSI